MHIPFEDRPLVYVAGPYTKPDPVENVHKMIMIRNRLQDTGLVTTFVPHISMLLHVIQPYPYDHWLEWDIAMLKRSDSLYRVEGYSSGADKEEEYCPTKDIPVYYDENLLLKWAVEWLHGHGYEGV